MCEMTEEKIEGLKHVSKDEFMNKHLGLYSPQSQMPRHQIKYRISNSWGNM